MLKAGLLPSPVIIPLSSNPLSTKNKIDTQTFIELRSGFILTFNYYSSVFYVIYNQMFQMYVFILLLMELNQIHFKYIDPAIYRLISIEEHFDLVQENVL